jgi:hypothetical protein
MVTHGPPLFNPGREKKKKRKAWPVGAEVQTLGQWPGDRLKDKKGC